MTPLPKYRQSNLHLLVTGGFLMVAFWFVDSYLDALSGAGSLRNYILHPALSDVVHRVQSIIFITVLIAYVWRKSAQRDSIARSLDAALEELVKERNRFAGLLAGIPDAVTLQTVDLKIIYQNPASVAAMGEHSGEYCYAAYHDRTTPCPDCALVESFKDGRLHKLVRQNTIHGQERCFEFLTAPLRDSNGAIIGGVESVRDITEHRRAEELLAQRLAAIESSLDGIAILDAAGLYTYLNRAHANIYGYDSADELVGKSWQNLYADEERQRLEPLIYEGFSRSRGWRGEATGKRKDGSSFPQEVSLTMLDDGGIICVVRDTSDRKRAEADIMRLNERLVRKSQILQAANQDLESFSYSLSHDLRTPLTAMYSAAQTLDDLYGSRFDETGNTLVETILNSCEKMEALIEAMLVLSRITKSDLKYQEVDLSELAQTIALELAQRNLETPVAFSCEEGVTAWCDPALTRILLENLLGNAWKYASQKEHPEVRFGCRREEGRRWFFVGDNGIGFDQQEAEIIFKPFQRSSSATHFPGIGIGLGTVQRIVDRHAGVIRAQGEVGVGATFLFSFPDPPDAM
ncbi:PAS domain-containing sensor histidine kinase [Geomonas sp. Red276]